MSREPRSATGITSEFFAEVRQAGGHYTNYSGLVTAHLVAVWILYQLAIVFETPSARARKKVRICRHGKGMSLMLPTGPEVFSGKDVQPYVIKKEKVQK